MKLNKSLSTIVLCACFTLPVYAELNAATETNYQAIQIAQNMPFVEFENPQILQVNKLNNATGSKMTIHNNGDEDLVITKFNCEGFGRTELHNSRFVNGEREMYEIKEITVPAHSKLALTPNKMHLMLFDPERDFEVGKYLKMEIETNLGKIPVIVEVVPRRLK